MPAHILIDAGIRNHKACSLLLLGGSVMDTVCAAQVVAPGLTPNEVDFVARSR